MPEKLFLYSNGNGTTLSIGAASEIEARKMLARYVRLNPTERAPWTFTQEAKKVDWGVFSTMEIN